MPLAAWMLLCAFLSQESPARAFEAVERARAFPRRSPERVADGYRYEILDGRLHRSREGPPAPVPCLQREGTGEVRALEHHPAGTTWAAAERGLFCISPETEMLDRIDLRDGAPVGELVGLARVADGRLWLATREAFGCVDAIQYFGRSFGPADGLPAGPYLALVPAADGSLLLATAEGIQRYTPERGEPPRVRMLSVDGRAPPASRELTIGGEGGFDIELEGSALGGASFRYRFARHHLWRALPGPRARIDGLEPGEHELHFAAYDRDLRRSDPAVLRVRVPYPVQYSKALLPPLVGGSAALFIAIALLRARGRGRRALVEALVSAVLALVVGLQLLAGFVPHGRGWPVVGYKMYTEVYREDDLTYRLSLYGVHQDGRRRLIRPWDSGEGQFVFQRELIPLLHGSRAERQRCFERFITRFGGGGRLAGLIVQDERHRLTARGAVRVAPIVMSVMPADLFDAPR